MSTMGPACAPPSTPVLSLADVTMSTVKPLQKTAHPETIELTLMDQMTKDSYQGTFFAYRFASELDPEAAYLQFLKRVRESLQRVLVPFFPFAGRLVPTLEDGRQLLCNDEGVPFIEGYLAKDLDSVVDSSVGFQPVPELQGHEFLGMDSTRFETRMVPDGFPAFFVQMTRFNCGGVVLGVTFNHQVTDGQGFYDFMTAWADLSRTNTSNIRPTHNRALAKSFEGVPIETVAESDGADSDVPPTESVIAGSEVAGEMAIKQFEVSASTIESIKRKAKESTIEGYVTTVDCINAHVLQNVVQLPSSIIGKKEVALINVVEGRNRFYDPPLPYLIGNVITTMVAPRIPTTELLEKPLHVTALKLREQLLATVWDSWFSPERAREFSKVFGSGEFARWVTNSFFSFPMYKIDFGFGKPFFSPGPTSKFLVGALGGFLILPPTPGNLSCGAILRLTSTPQVIDALQAVPSFLPFFLQPVQKG